MIRLVDCTCSMLPGAMANVVLVCSLSLTLAREALSLPAENTEVYVATETWCTDGGAVHLATCNNSTYQRACVALAEKRRPRWQDPCWCSMENRIELNYLRKSSIWEMVDWHTTAVTSMQPGVPLDKKRFDWSKAFSVCGSSERGHQY